MLGLTIVNMSTTCSLGLCFRKIRQIAWMNQDPDSVSLIDAVPVSYNKAQCSLFLFILMTLEYTWNAHRFPCNKPGTVEFATRKSLRAAHLISLAAGSKSESSRLLAMASTSSPLSIDAGPWHRVLRALWGFSPVSINSEAYGNCSNMRYIIVY